MKVLIKQARILSSTSPFHGKIKDILVMDGKIHQVAEAIKEPVDSIFEQENLHVSIGWMDIFADFGDPGYEFRETLESGAAAAAAGGFTDLLLIPNTKPGISSRTEVEYVIQKTRPLAVNIYPIGSATALLKGKELSEMYDMYSVGAKAFGDGKQSIQDADLLLKALQYVIPINAPVIQVPDDRSIAPHGLMNEGITSTRLGLPGRPALAEELMIDRDLELLRYSGSKLHITGISTRKGIESVKKAKKEGLQVTCSATPFHAYFSEEDLMGYDTNLKVNPPLRTLDDKVAIQEGLVSGVIDCWASHHLPQHTDDKDCEFEKAKNGVTGLESMFGVCNSVFQPLDKLIEIFTIHPRRIFGIPIPEISVGAEACLTLFDPTVSYQFEKNMIRSTSSNNPFIGKKLKGKVIGILNKKQVIKNHP